jgi:homocysteine S-methyltransferase
VSVDPSFPAGPGPVVLDGGLATELEARGHDLSGALWSARLLADAPDAIVAAHRAFFAAGADVATTASYQASFSGFAAAGIEAAQTTRLLRRSVALARAARDGFADGRRRWVAASVGPYGAALADGSEYRGRYGLGVDALAAWHRPRLEVLASAGADLLALETVPDAVEAEALVAALDGLAVPAWLSYSVSGPRTRAGQPLAEAFAVAAGAPQVVAVGVNCCEPADVGPAIAAARSVTGKPVIVYPNSGEDWDAVRRCWTGRPRFAAADAAAWVAHGAAAVGGCCRVGPAGIAAVARTLDGAGGAYHRLTADTAVQQPVVQPPRRASDGAPPRGNH